jgi:hypothetical protein
MVENLRLATSRTRTLLGALAVSAALALGFQAMAPASADAMRSQAECDHYVEYAVYYLTHSNYPAYERMMSAAQTCYGEL